MRPLDVVLTTHTFDLGGTEKCLVNHALAFDREKVRPRAVAVDGPGRRDATLRAAGIEVDHAHNDSGRLAELLRGADVVHACRGGLHHPLIPAACREAGVGTLVETNIFGFYDTSADERDFACHLFISKMCAMRYRQAVGLAHTRFHDRHRVLYVPIDVKRLRSLAPPSREARAALGLDPDRPVVGRIGRADDRKWSPIVLAMLPVLFSLVPDAQVLLVGLTPERRRQLKRLGLEDRVLALEPTGDEALLATYYAACDVLAAGSAIGESFGVALAEALALGIPVVTSSTPWTDNAQVEVIENGHTGWIANHPRPFGEAIAHLLLNERERGEFAARCRQEAERRFDSEALTRRLETLYVALSEDGRGPTAWDPNPEALEEFEREYPQRATAQFRQLSPREKLEARLTVFAERMQWLMKDVRQDPWGRLRVLPAMIRARFRRSE